MRRVALEEFGVAVAVGLVVQDKVYVVDGFQGSGRDRVVVPGQQAFAATGERFGKVCSRRMLVIRAAKRR
jgi:hypothetical protein